LGPEWGALRLAFFRTDTACTEYRRLSLPLIGDFGITLSAYIPVLTRPCVGPQFPPAIDHYQCVLKY
jgi:hypothetical protein